VLFRSLGSVQIQALTYEKVMEFFHAKDFPRPTAHMVRGILNSILGLAYELQRIDRNPIKLVPVVRKIRKAKQNLTVETVNKVLAAAAGTRMEGPCYAASHIGLRRGEVCALKVTDLNAAKSCIELKATRDKFGEGSLKGRQKGETRTIPIPASIFEKLRSFIKPGQIYLFTDRDFITGKERPIHPDRISKTMQKLCQQAGVELLRFHDLRAAASSNLLRAGVDPFTIQRILGHSSIDTTAIYIDENEADTRSALSRLATAYDVKGES